MKKVFYAYIAATVLAISMFVTVVLYKKDQARVVAKQATVETSRYFAYHSFSEYSVEGNTVTPVKCIPDFDTRVIMREDSIFFFLPNGQKYAYKTVKIEKDHFYGESFGNVVKFNLEFQDSVLAFKPTYNQFILLSTDRKCPKSKP